MEHDRTVSMLVHAAQWARCAHEGTSLLPGGGVELTWTDDADADEDRCRPRTAATRPCEPAGLAFDPWCTAYRSRPELGTVDAYAVSGSRHRSVCPNGMHRPRGLAVDGRGRLYVAEPGGRDVLVVDLDAGRPLRRVHLGPGRPVDVARHCGQVIALVRDPDALVLLDGRRRPRRGPALVRPACVDGMWPARVATGPLVLWVGDGRGLIATPDGAVRLDVDGATDIEAMPDGVLVVARGPGSSFRRFVHTDWTFTELEPVGAPGYDGGAIAAMPDGRIAYTVAGGYATTVGSVAEHVTSGSVVTYRLDSGEYLCRWGRLFLDACLPPSTSVVARFLTSDVDDVVDELPPSPPARGTVPVPHEGQTPPLPPRAFLAVTAGDQVLFRRPTGREEPWVQLDASDVFETYEAPVSAPPGRYLWVQLILRGTASVTPRIQAMRIERPGHRLLHSLPRAWSHDEGDASFLHAYLTPIDGILHELDWRAAERAVLVDPRATPQEALAWLASFAGLVLDRRWDDHARRTLVAEAYQLFARRGTKAALIRLLEIYLGRAPAIVEQWQVRGLGGTVLGTVPGPVAPVVGGSAAATGTLGRFTVGGSHADSDSYRLAAHRFIVLVAGELTPEQRTVVRGLIETHRPAHTIGEVCELGSGMRVGERLRVALTSFVGPGAAWRHAIVGDSRIGGDGVIGTPAVGARLGEAAVGQVRVG